MILFNSLKIIYMYVCVVNITNVACKLIINKKVDYSRITLFLDCAAVLYLTTNQTFVLWS
jgi:hypothetical protein